MTTMEQRPTTDPITHPETLTSVWIADHHSGERGVFSTRALAERYLARLAEHYGPTTLTSIDEYPLDPE